MNGSLLLRMKIRFFLILLAWIPWLASNAQKSSTRFPVYQGPHGTIRWTKTGREADFFGANYCLYSSSDYRAAGYIHADRKAMVHEDIEQFARMGWNALRLSFWGDFENSDQSGNLVDNAHLDLMDYTIYQAQKRGIYLLLSPIVTYNSLWPDALKDTSSIHGFSTKYPKSILGTSIQARRVQERYLRQLLNHVNPYTGHRIKDEPNLLFIEMVNEPDHHVKDLSGSVQYINSLVDAVRSTGARQLLFHNLTQNLAIAPALNRSRIDGASIGWYPSGLNSGHMLHGNFLPAVDHYTPLLKPILNPRLSRLVYEFETPDLLTGYLYPAMARSFREAGIQWASMFAYDMLQTAPYNLGWQTHFLNLVYTPEKAVSAIIAREAMEYLPRFLGYGNYPQDTAFGDFRVSYRRDLAEILSDSVYMFDNNTQDAPAHPASLKRIVGFRNSPIVQYSGNGAYFLDRIRPGVWRLELYPDAERISDPFAMPRPGKVVVASWHRFWPMELHLPDLGSRFQVIPLNSKNTYHPAVHSGRFLAYPGVYILESVPGFKVSSLPASFGYIGMREFYCPKDLPVGYHVRLLSDLHQVAGSAKQLEVSVSGPQMPDSVKLFVQRTGTRWFSSVPMHRQLGTRYSAVLPSYLTGPGYSDVQVVVYHHGTSEDFPSADSLNPSDWDYAPLPSWHLRWDPPGSALALLHLRKQASRLAFSRIGDAVRYPLYRIVSDSLEASPSLSLYFPLHMDSSLSDYSVRVPLGNLCRLRTDLDTAGARVTIRVRGKQGAQKGLLTFIDAQGRCWSHRIDLSAQWKVFSFALDSMKPSVGVNLPEGFPGDWDYWIPLHPASSHSAGILRISEVQSMELSLRKGESLNRLSGPSWMEISDIDVVPVHSCRELSSKKGIESLLYTGKVGRMKPADLRVLPEPGHLSFGILPGTGFYQSGCLFQRTSSIQYLKEFRIAHCLKRRKMPVGQKARGFFQPASL